MLKNAIKVHVPYSNSQVFGYGGQVEQVHNEVYEWLESDLVVNWRHVVWSTDYQGPFIAQAKIGLIFEFECVKDALLFKLTWGGS